MLEDQDLVSIQEVRHKVERAYAAWKRYRTFSQEQVDVIVERMAAAAKANARRLARLAVEETGYGNVKDKTVKNLLTSDLLAKRIRGIKTIGLLRELPGDRVVEYGVPMGVVAAILPVTNPTSSVIFKTLISLKAGNAIVISPHPNARRCTCETADLLYRAALEAGAPEGIIQCAMNATIDGTNALMRHECTAVILATGGAAMVRAAYSSGKPAYGVGPGNVCVLIERSADLADAMEKVVAGKIFDHGTVCSSEQTIVIEDSAKDRVLAELKARKAFLCNEEQTEALGRLLPTPKGTINPQCVGQPAAKIARMAGFEVPADTSVLVTEIHGVGPAHPLSAEKLSPVLAVYTVKDFGEGMDVCEELLRFGGIGHTCVIYSQDEARIREFAMRMPASRILVNTSAPQGSVGVTTNLMPSMTLGCGAVAGNATSDNVGVEHLFNVKRLAYAVRSPDEALEIPEDGLAMTALAGAGVIDRQTVMAIVERYLAERGLLAAAPRAQGSIVSNLAAEVADRLLAPPGRRAAVVKSNTGHG